MKASTQAFDLIKSFEGCRLKAYKDPGSKNGLPITIGWGSTMYIDGRKIQLGDVITQEQADELLEWEIAKKTAVLGLMGLKLNQNQFDSLTSFVFNIGFGNLNKSTLLKKVRQNPNDPAIGIEFMKWIYNDGKQLKGLIRRRTAEKNLYFK